MTHVLIAILLISPSTTLLDDNAETGLKGLWRCYGITNSEDKPPTQEDAETGNRAFLIFDDRILDVPSLTPGSTTCYPVNIRARETTVDGKTFCLLDYPEEYSVGQGVLIIKQVKLDGDHTVARFEVRSTEGHKSISCYWLSRPSREDAKSIMDQILNKDEANAPFGNQLKQAVLRQSEIDLIRKQHD